MTFIFIALFFLYVAFVGLLIVGWNKAVKQELPFVPEYKPLISVIIPARNEGAHIGALLADIQNQSYHRLEVIVVSDNSNDNTEAIAASVARTDARFMVIQSDGEGKKVALTTGINRSRGALIVTTDADCNVYPTWLEEICRHFVDDDVKMVFGGVRMEGNSFFSKLQAHEFLSLIGTSASTWALGFPIMCNGANLAFRKSVFMEVGGYNGNYHVPSGDDEFLMRKILRTYPGGIRFLPRQNGVVKTITCSDVKAFMDQRIRWAGKWRHSLSGANIVLGLFIFLFHTSVLLLPMAMYGARVSVLLGAALLTLKALAEGIFLKKVADFLSIGWDTRIFLMLQFMYPFYAIFFALFSIFAPFEWKGRKLRSLSAGISRDTL